MEIFMAVLFSLLLFQSFYFGGNLREGDLKEIVLHFCRSTESQLNQNFQASKRHGKSNGKND